MKDEKQTDKARRDFLRGSVAAGAGATVAAALPGAALAGDESEVVKAPQDEHYRVTKHISDYYKSTL